MGTEVNHQQFSGDDRVRFRSQVSRGTEAIARMLTDGLFTDQGKPPDPLLGMEVELNLVDGDADPAMANVAVLDAIADPDFQTELGQFNIEINVAPRPFVGGDTVTLEQSLRSSLNRAESRAAATGNHLVMVGMLPTLRHEHFASQWISTNPRYRLLDEQIFAARGEALELDIAGVPMAIGNSPDLLKTTSESILPEAACTSLQLHLRVAPEDFAAHWNAAQAISGVQVAIAGNSPFLDGKALWHETRIPVFEQATDTRPLELKNQGVRPRVWFGERWINTIFDLFEENTRYFPALLPVSSDVDPLAELDAGRIPKLDELRLHNGTVYRWNRPVYDVVDGHAHLRVENRVLPAGPTVVDIMANAAFYYGVVRGLVESDLPVWSQMSFDAAEENLSAGARWGFGAQLYWPNIGWVRPDELVLRRLLPLAERGLTAFGVSDKARRRYLGVIEGRCATKQSGSVWQRKAVFARQQAGESRDQALHGMLKDYVTLMHEGEPVHAWPV
ncbi:glutamate-cysteine ligase family protein [Gordonia sp. (in: high G+C Gram-positive bacteria)]|uniref:glutamate-cysteine ligase family protein n=1 Tax=Gordonia sp. (in: high G+C Gram-positive bacteria) TaxID=84139 RepID=UPI0016B2F8CB|nr:glutamate-cysteine ligase family protein [Gordonia sp. (in: high G+C Gram-positive bacteria)]NLG47177.1 glutamate--cysteine ligase [Gordonia sp. (in: high G+C Gram-positive bacteria)]